MQFFFLLLAGCVALVGAQAPSSSVSLEERVWVATKLYATVQMVNAHGAGAPEFDLDRDYRTYLKAALSATDRRAFDLATFAFMSKLRNGHSGFYDKWLYETYGQPLGFTLVPMKEGWVVNTTRLPDLHPGDVLATVDGRPMEQLFAEVAPLLEGSSDATRRRSFPFHTFLWPQKFVLGLTDRRQVTIDRSIQKLGTTRTFPFPQSPVTPAGVGFIRIASFEDASQETAAVARVKELQQARAIIIDVRGNGGGSTPGRLLTALLDRPWREMGYTTPVHIAHATAQNQVRAAFPGVDTDPYLRGYLDAFDEFKNAHVLTYGAQHPPLPDAYKGKVILLVDGYCNSACEDFIQPFKSSGRGILVGEASNGSSGQPYYFDFGNGMSFRVSSKRYFLPDGTPFEGVGIQPDIPVTPTVADWKAGKDPVLARALDLAQQN